jgi:hypothetical protein
LATAKEREVCRENKKRNEKEKEINTRESDRQRKSTSSCKHIRRPKDNHKQHEKKGEK